MHLLTPQYDSNIACMPRSKSAQIFDGQSTPDVSYLVYFPLFRVKIPVDVKRFAWTSLQ